MNTVARLCLTKHRGWLLSTILSLLLGFCFLILSVYKPDWMFIECGHFHTEFGIWTVCGQNTSGSAMTGLKDCQSLLMRTDISVPHWFSSVQFMCVVSVVFLCITIVICCLYIYVKPEGNVPLGITGLCMSCASFLVIVTMSASNISKTHRQADFITLIKEIFDVTCIEPKFKVSSYSLLTGISTVLVTLAGVWALLASCLVASGIGNISSQGIYIRARSTDLQLEQEVNHGFSFDSDGSDDENYGSNDFGNNIVEIEQARRHRRNSVIIDTALNF